MQIARLNLSASPVSFPRMNEGLSVVWRIVAVVALLVIVGGVWWFARGLIYEWLPRDLSILVSGLFVGLLIGWNFGDWSARKEIKKARDSTTPNSRR